MTPLHLLLLVDHHIVTQVVKAQLVVGAVGDVRLVGGFFLVVAHSVDYKPHFKTHKAVELAHPFRVTLGKVIVYRYYMHAFSGQSIQIRRKRRHESFTFTCLHFGYTSLMKHYSAEYLNGEVAHAEHPVRRFPAGGKRFGQDIVKRFARRKPFLELAGFRL